MRKMKDSGIEWIGEIPEEWRVMRIKYLASRNLQYGANESGVNFNEELPRYIRITDISQDNKLKNDDMLSLEEEKAEKYILNDGDILFARSGATAGKSFYFRKEYGYACYAGYLIRLVVDSSVIDSKLVYYYTLTSSYEDWINQIFIQATIQNVSADKYNNLYIPVSENKEEQQKIADYLDNKCAEIDAVIKSKEMTNEKLKEYRQSIIYETVTKGLDNNVPMKDSGIEWIGEMPEEWRLERLKYLTELRLEKNKGLNELMYIGLEHVESNTGKTIKDYEPIYDFDGDTITFYEGDILFGKLRPYLAKVILTRTDGKCSSEFFALMANGIINKYLYYLMLSQGFMEIVNSSTYGVKMPRAEWGFVGNLKVPIPSQTEQQEIAEYLDKKCAEIDSVISANEITIKKLKEYRQSVIFEAVTGKMDIESLSK